MLETPGFHHLHLNSVDPDAAIDWYVRQFPSCTKGGWAGIPGAAVAQQRDGAVQQGRPRRRRSQPQSAIWHFGWHVTDARQSLATYQERAGRAAAAALHHR